MSLTGKPIRPLVCNLCKQTCQNSADFVKHVDEVHLPMRGAHQDLELVPWDSWKETSTRRHFSRRERSALHPCKKFLHSSKAIVHARFQNVKPFQECSKKWKRCLLETFHTFVENRVRLPHSETSDHCHPDRSRGIRRRRHCSSDPVSTKRHRPSHRSLPRDMASIADTLKSGALSALAAIKDYADKRLFSSQIEISSSCYGAVHPITDSSNSRRIDEEEEVVDHTTSCEYKEYGTPLGNEKTPKEIAQLATRFAYQRSLKSAKREEARQLLNIPSFGKPSPKRTWTPANHRRRLSEPSSSRGPFPSGYHFRRKRSKHKQGPKTSLLFKAILNSYRKSKQNSAKPTSESKNPCESIECTKKVA